MCVYVIPVCNVCVYMSFLFVVYLCICHSCWQYISVYVIPVSNAYMCMSFLFCSVYVIPVCSVCMYMSLLFPLCVRILALLTDRFGC